MIKLGDECRDEVTGFKGIAVARTEWLNGCARVVIQPPVGKDGKCPEAMTFDEPQLIVTKAQKIKGPEMVEKAKKETGKTGGPDRYPTTQKSTPSRR